MKTKILKTIVLTLLFTAGLGFKAKAQNSWIEVNNFSTCPSGYTVTAYDAGSNILDQISNPTTAPPYNAGNVCPITTAIASIVVVVPLGCTIITFTPNLGVFANQSVSKTCCGGNSVSITETNQTTCGVNTHHITININ